VPEFVPGQIYFNVQETGRTCCTVFLWKLEYLECFHEYTLLQIVLSTENKTTSEVLKVFLEIVS